MQLISTVESWQVRFYESSYITCANHVKNKLIGHPFVLRCVAVLPWFGTYGTIVCLPLGPNERLFTLFVLLSLESDV